MLLLLFFRLVVKGITPSMSVDHWHPLIVLANPNSGGKDGQTILSSFRKLLNPVQVLDLSEFGPECGLEICRFLPEHTCRVLACGGDGTVGWILAAIDKANLPVSKMLLFSSPFIMREERGKKNKREFFFPPQDRKGVTCTRPLWLCYYYSASSPCGYLAPGHW